MDIKEEITVNILTTEFGLYFVINNLNFFLLNHYILSSRPRERLANTTYTVFQYHIDSRFLRNQFRNSMKASYTKEQTFYFPQKIFKENWLLLVRELA